MAISYNDNATIIKSVATLRMFIAAHNTVTPMERITAEELDLLEESANELERILKAQKTPDAYAWGDV